MAYITISQRQTPCFRALIAKEDGTLFDKATDLATAASLAAVLPEEEKIRMGLPVETEPTEKTESAATADEDAAAIAAN